MSRSLRVLLAVVVLVNASACARANRPNLPPSPAPPGASLWKATENQARLDLYYGRWGRENAPDPDAVFTLVERKHTGVNPGLTVTDREGREWSVKQAPLVGLDDEGPVEVTLSRLLSAAGYHQPPVYYLPRFTLKDAWGTRTERGGRFRLKMKELKDAGSWAWEDNPFVGTRPYQGLLVLLMMFNSTDLKASNNSIFEHRDGDRVEHWYAVRDIGAALGDTDRLTPRKNHPDHFERHPFLVGTDGDYVEFAYRSWYQRLVKDRITRDDVTWASRQLATLSDRQWQDAFRAGGYEPEVAARFIRTLREKIHAGQMLAAPSNRRVAAGER